MKHEFILICTTIVVVALLTAYGLAPIMWDAAGAIGTILTEMPTMQ